MTYAVSRMPTQIDSSLSWLKKGNRRPIVKREISEKLKCRAMKLHAGKSQASIIIMADDDILSLEDGWRLYLEKRFGDKITSREKLSIARHYARLKLAPPELERNSELLRRFRQCGGDIVHGWDDERDFSIWKAAFKLLKPPAMTTRKPKF